jgi:RNA polymerase sigma factor (sigma-70 family)
VTTPTDQQLLREYTNCRAEPAFAELVRRHVDLVYSAALRMVRDIHLAEDVTQGVFVALARNAPQLAERPVLSGWLHRAAQNLAANTVRSDVRRRAREQEAAAMNELLSAEPGAVWEHVAPHLDEALGKLNETDRDAVLLRYFERKSAREMAQTLGTTEEAAQKRVNRAVERLHGLFLQRGVTVGASGLVVALIAHAIQAAPAGLAVNISAAAALAATGLHTSTAIAATKAIAMTTLQKTIIGAALAAAVGVGVYEARQVSGLRAEVQRLRQQQAEQLQQLQRERDEAAAQLGALRERTELLKSNAAEVVTLRGEVTRLRAQERELTRLRQPTRPPPAAPAPPDAPSTTVELPKDSWADAGFATPKAALRTRGWAVLSGDRQRFRESVFITDGARKTLEDLFVKMAEASKVPTRRGSSKRFSRTSLAWKRAFSCR